MTNLTFTHDPLRDLDEVLAPTAALTEGRHLEVESPFCGGWIGCFSYDLGRWIEPSAQSRPSWGKRASEAAWPLIELAYCPDALVHDNVRGEWRTFGAVDESIVGALNGPWSGSDLRRSRGRTEPDEQFVTGDLRAALDPHDYRAMVARTLDYIRAGDVYQANVAQWFSADFAGSTRALARTALETSAAWYGGYLEFAAGRAIVSMSPELFLAQEARSGAVTTRPIKGTAPRSADPRELLHSAKDAAELHMIVDLMRSDLGRVCDIGSVRVVDPRSVETHGTVHHGVAEIRGRLRRDVTPGRLLRATFPGGSVTGAPKIRAMQIIDELESVGQPRARGPYCGAIGFISDSGSACFNVAIRTMLLHGRSEPGRFDRLSGQLEYAAGCGVVADSDPAAEFRESLDKTAALRQALAGSAVEPAARELTVNLARA